MTHILHRAANAVMPVAVSGSGVEIAGVEGDHILLAPSFIVEAPEAEAIVERLGAALDAALAGVR